MTLLLLSCSYSWCQSEVNDSILPTGDEYKTDSVLVSIDALRIANSKMIELKYEKEINEYLRNTIQTDSILISSLHTNLSVCKINTETKIAEIKKERNTAIAIGSGTSLLFLLLFIIAL